MAKRAFDVCVATAALLLTAPLWPVVAIVIRVTSAGPILYRARRVGRDGELFTLYKFRTMTVATGPDAGLGITAAHDSRITPVGRHLRAFKVDELPQLLNVMKGEMSIVGPRPEDPRYVEGYDDEQRGVLAVRPGLTSPATLAYRHEEAILAASADVDHTYRTVVLPEKLRIDLEYARRPSLLTDVRVVFATAAAIARRSPPATR